MTSTSRGPLKNMMITYLLKMKGLANINLAQWETAQIFSTVFKDNWYNFYLQTI